MYQYNHLKKEFDILNYKPVSSVFLNSNFQGGNFRKYLTLPFSWF